MTDQPLTIVQALAEVMRLVPAVSKDQAHTQGWNFRGIDGVLNKVGPAFREVGVVCTPKVLEHHAATIQVGGNRTTMNGVTLLVQYRFHGPAGDYVAAEVPGEAMDSGDKAYSKAMSVAYRTALIQVLAIPTHERDPDEDTYERAQEGPQEPEMPAEVLQPFLDRLKALPDHLKDDARQEFQATWPRKPRAGEEGILSEFVAEWEAQAAKDGAPFDTPAEEPSSGG